jgi:hypothetical protein
MALNKFCFCFDHRLGVMVKSIIYAILRFGIAFLAAFEIRFQTSKIAFQILKIRLVFS